MICEECKHEKGKCNVFVAAQFQKLVVPIAYPKC